MDENGEVSVKMEGSCAACCVDCQTNFDVAIEKALKEHLPLQVNYGAEDISPPGHP